MRWRKLVRTVLTSRLFWSVVAVGIMVGVTLTVKSAAASIFSDVVSGPEPQMMDH